jgi:hypothetical protein
VFLDGGYAELARWTFSKETVMKANSRVDEIRQHRAAILKEAGGTLDLLVERLRELEANQQQRMVAPPASKRAPAAQQ